MHRNLVLQALATFHDCSDMWSDGLAAVGTDNKVGAVVARDIVRVDHDDKNLLAVVMDLRDRVSKADVSWISLFGDSTEDGLGSNQRQVARQRG